MIENQFISTVDTLSRGMDQFTGTETMAGESVQAGNTIVVSLIDVTCGMAAGSFTEGAKQKHRDDEGVNAKMSPNIVLIIQGGVAKLVNVENQDTIAKVIGMAPDFISEFLGGKPTMSEETIRIAKDIVAVYDTGKAEHMDVR